jgi:hypothetical protein
MLEYIWTKCLISLIFIEINRTKKSCFVFFFSPGVHQKKRTPTPLLEINKIKMVDAPR